MTPFARISFISLLLMSTGRHGCASLDITTVSSDPTQFEGSNVTLGCTVAGRGFDYFFNQIIWYKVLSESVDEEESEIQINTGAIINEPFYNTRRYFIEPVLSEYSAEISLLLTITGIQREDNGTYRCVLFNKQQRISNVHHSLFVPASVDLLNLLIHNIDEDMDSISENISVHTTTVANGDGSHGASHQVDENQSVRVICVTSGTGRVPEVRVTLGPRVDITSTFNRVQTEHRTGPRGLEVVHYEVRLVRDWLQLTADDDGKHIRCTARVHGFQDLTRKVTKTLEVRYAPKFMCGKERSVTVKERSYRLECSVRANPIVNASDVTWQIGDINVTNMTAGETNEVFSSTAQVDDERRNQLNVALTINEMSLSRYHIYRLLASNSIGQRHFHIAVRPTNTRPIHPITVDVAEAFDAIYSTNKAPEVHPMIVTSSIATCFLHAFNYLFLNF